GEMMTAVLSGETQIMFNSAPNVLTQVKAGQLRALAVTTAPGKRLRLLPDVPSFGEAGLPGMTVYAWNGLIGPAHVPHAVTARLQVAFARALASPAVREKFNALGGESDFNASSPEQFGSFIRSEIVRWTAVIKSAGITPE